MGFGGLITLGRAAVMEDPYRLLRESTGRLVSQVVSGTGFFVSNNVVLHMRARRGTSTHRWCAPSSFTHEDGWSLRSSGKSCQTRWPVRQPRTNLPLS